jgi:glutamyl-tRNA reductase
VALVRQALGDLHRKSVLVVGAGDAARLTAQALSGAGAGRILVSTRTLDRALDIATQLGAFAYPFEEMPHLLAEVDIVISSTSAASHVITREQVALAARARKRHPLVLVDIAVPRDIDPGVAELPNVRLFDIDDLQTQAEINRQNRLQEVEAVEAIVEQEVERFAEWLRQHGATPTIAGLRSRAEAIRAAEVQRTLARLPDLSAADRKRIESMSQAILKRLLHEPVTRLKDGAEQHHIDAIRELFALDKDAQK